MQGIVSGPKPAFRLVRARTIGDWSTGFGPAITKHRSVLDHGLAVESRMRSIDKYHAMPRLISPSLLAFRHDTHLSTSTVIVDPRSYPPVEQHMRTTEAMLFRSNNRRKSSTASASSASSMLSARSSMSSLDLKTLEMTLPIAPREDDYNMSEASRKQRLLARCRKAQEPWKNAQPLPPRE